MEVQRHKPNHERRRGRGALLFIPHSSRCLHKSIEQGEQARQRAITLSHSPISDHRLFSIIMYGMVAFWWCGSNEKSLIHHLISDSSLKTNKWQRQVGSPNTFSFLYTPISHILFYFIQPALPHSSSFHLEKPESPNHPYTTTTTTTTTTILCTRSRRISSFRVQLNTADKSITILNESERATKTMG